MENIANPSRRRLFKGKIHQANVLRLPWVISKQVFIDQCTQCNHCVDICETDIIVKDEQGYPRVDFSLGECTFCQKCHQSCEQPLFIEHIENQKPWPISIEISDNCLAKNNIFCQSCRDECEANAINFSYLVNGEPSVIPQPTIDLDKCTQCGACVSSCPPSVITTHFNV